MRAYCGLKACANEPMKQHTINTNPSLQPDLTLRLEMISLDVSPFLLHSYSNHLALSNRPLLFKNIETLDGIRGLNQRLQRQHKQKDLQLPLKGTMTE